MITLRFASVGFFVVDWRTVRFLFFSFCLYFSRWWRMLSRYSIEIPTSYYANISSDSLGMIIIGYVDFHMFVGDFPRFFYVAFQLWFVVLAKANFGVFEWTILSLRRQNLCSPHLLIDYWQLLSQSLVQW